MLLIVGDVDPQATMALVKKYYGAVEAGYVPAKIVAEPAQKGSGQARSPIPGQTLPILNIAYKGDALRPGQRATTWPRWCWATWRSARTSELYKKLVVQTAEGRVHRRRRADESRHAAVPNRGDGQEGARTSTTCATKSTGRWKSSRRSRSTPPGSRRSSGTTSTRFLMELDSAGGVAERLGAAGRLDRRHRGRGAALRGAGPRDPGRASRGRPKKYFDARRRTVMVLRSGANEWQESRGL